MDYNFELLLLEPETESFKTFKSVLKSQHDQVCRSSFSDQYISNLLNALTSSHFGYAAIVPTAYAKTRRSSKYSILGFIIAGKDHEGGINIELICGRKDTPKIGTYLMNLMISECKNMGMKLIDLQSLIDSKLIAWYEQFGFKKMSHFKQIFVAKLQPMRMYL
jgi:hypothetical protein